MILIDNDKSKRRKRRLALLFTICIILSLLFIPITLRPDGKYFCKIWSGAVDEVKGNVTITDKDTGQVYWDAPIPQNHKTCVTVAHKTVVVIKWTDWRGTHEEEHRVLCAGGQDELYNVIPYPKSGRTV